MSSRKKNKKKSLKDYSLFFLIFVIAFSASSALIMPRGMSFAAYYVDLWKVSDGQDPATDTIYRENGEVVIGDTTASGTLLLDVAGQVGATEYCDETGGNCTAAGSLGGARQIDDLSDAKHGTDSSLFLGNGSGTNDDGNNSNTGIGASALYSNTTGGSNTGIGNRALYSNTTGRWNTASGIGALQNNTGGDSNTGLGSSALQNNTGGDSNTGLGYRALYYNTTGHSNTGIGVSALFSNTTGRWNTASGLGALQNNTGGFANTASGVDALYSNTTGDSNTGIGVSALRYTTGDSNTGIGNRALYSNTTGYGNTASGVSALYHNTTGGSNTASGIGALRENITGGKNTAFGQISGDRTNANLPNQTSNNSLYLGYDSRSSADGNTNEIVIGYTARGNGSNTVTLGNDAIVTTVLKGRVGIGTTTPSTTLSINGSISTGVRSISVDTTVTTSDHQLFCDASAGQVNVDLPAAATVKGMRLFVKKTDATGNKCRFYSSGLETIDGYSEAFENVQYANCTIVSDGNTWYVVGGCQLL